jgi:hypothetical protein
VSFSRPAFALSTRSFRGSGRFVPPSSIPVEDRIPTAVEKRLHVFMSPQLMDGCGHVMKAGGQVVDVAAQGRDRRGIAERRLENPTP